MKFSSDLFVGIDALPSRSRAAFPEITDDVFWGFYDIASRFSLVHVTGFLNVYQSMRYIAANDIPGDIVECGCFLGGIGIFLGLLRRHFNIKAKIYLYDTFDGPPEGEVDVVRGTIISSGKLPPYYETVVANIDAAVGTNEGYVLVAGLVEETLAVQRPDLVSLLRLDTDFSSSTTAALNALYPTLVRGGVLIIDDYGMFDGARRATDEYLAKESRQPLLNRIDDAVWSCVKP